MLTRRQQQQLRETRARRRDQLALVAKMLAEPAGREYFWDLMQWCGIEAVNPSSNALLMANYEGQRAVGLHILADVREASVEAYHQMMKEAPYVRDQSGRDERSVDGESVEPTDDADRDAGF